MVLNEGGRLAELGEATLAELDHALPPTWGRRNPVNLFADATAARYRDALGPLLADAGVDAIVAINTPSAVGDTLAAASAVAERLAGERKPVVAVWLEESTRDETRRVFADRRIPLHEGPGEAIEALMQLVRYRRNQDMLMETPASVPELFQRDAERARDIVRRAHRRRPGLAERAGGEASPGRVLHPRGAGGRRDHAGGRGGGGGENRFPGLDPHQRLRRHGRGPRRPRRHRPEPGKPGGGRNGGAAPPAQTRRAAPRPSRSRGLPSARTSERITITSSASASPSMRASARWCCSATPPQMLQDQAVGLPPLNLNLAHRLITESRVDPLLRGYGDRPAANLDEIAETLVKLSQLAAELAEIVEAEIDPLLADAQGVLAVAARIRVAPSERAGGRAFGDPRVPDRARKDGSRARRPDADAAADPSGRRARAAGVRSSPIAGGSAAALLFARQAARPPDGGAADADRLRPGDGV